MVYRFPVVEDIRLSELNPADGQNLRAVLPFPQPADPVKVGETQPGWSEPTPACPSLQPL